jgi:hypothetical protein
LHAARRTFSRPPLANELGGLIDARAGTFHHAFEISAHSRDGPLHLAAGVPQLRADNGQQREMRRNHLLELHQAIEAAPAAAQYADPGADVSRRLLRNREVAGHTRQFQEAADAWVIAGHIQSHAASPKRRLKSQQHLYRAGAHVRGRMPIERHASGAGQQALPFGPQIRRGFQADLAFQHKKCMGAALFHNYAARFLCRDGLVGTGRMFENLFQECTSLPVWWRIAGHCVSLSAD